MRKLKDSGVEWIGEIPEEWELRRWKYVLSERKEKNDPIITNFILSLSVENGVFPYSEKTGGGNKAKEDLSAYKVARPNDIVMNSMNILAGAVGLSSWLGAVSPVYYTYYSDNDRADINYYCYLFQSEQFQRSLLGLGNGILIKESGNGKLNTIRMRIPSEKLNRLLIPIPPISEQQRIAKFLDEKTAIIDDIITDTKQTIAELKSYKQSLISEIVTNGINKDVKMVSTEIDWIDEIPEGWEVAKIKNISKLRNEKTSYERGQNFLALEKMVSYKPGYIDLLTEVENGRQQVIKQGDIVFSKLRPYLAKVALADFDGHGTGELLVFNDIKIKRKLFMYKLISEQILQPVRGTSYGVKMPRANPDFIISLPISFPISLSEQSEIVNYLDQKTSQIDTLIIEKENLISEYEYYKKSMIYEYVTGKKQVDSYES
ncbi:restriction endonuclease subunit S [Streptococcus mitis]|uniref:EcoKI restriction-modification system protein HsdS n=1 Tax=Streptococcus mitis TaxID=28037 RepID=A0A428D0F8_STRMT|nr:restriction endonuclease subunit S [Streptococcus mitis]RSI85576.1 EcoKI restriction-modification system protein HsdS [Streptococcus mitis]